MWLWWYQTHLTVIRFEEFLRMLSFRLQPKLMMGMSKVQRVIFSWTISLWNKSTNTNWLKRTHEGLEVRNWNQVYVHSVTRVWLRDEMDCINAHANIISSMLICLRKARHLRSAKSPNSEVEQLVLCTHLFKSISNQLMSPINVEEKTKFKKCRSIFAKVSQSNPYLKKNYPVFSPSSEF